MVDPDVFSERDLDLVVDFGAGLLDDAQRTAVLARAARDPRFEALLREHLADAEAARLDRPRAQERPRRIGLRLLLPVAVAAVIAAVVLIPPRLRGPAAPDYWLKTPWQENVTRSDEEPDALSRAIAVYEAHDLPRAIALLDSLRLTNGRDDLRRLYLASALLQAGEVERGRALLHELDVETLPSPWREEAERLLDRSSHHLR